MKYQMAACIVFLFYFYWLVMCVAITKIMANSFEMQLLILIQNSAGSLPNENWALHTKACDSTKCTIDVYFTMSYVV